MSADPIGVFDSGVGGLSILREIRRLLPNEDLIYFADQAHVPYGSRPLEEVRAFSQAITDFLLLQGAKLIVVACNTASAASLNDLRRRHAEVPFVGMEPAVKPAVSATQTGRIGVLATPATFQGELFGSVVERFAEGLEVHRNTVPGLVERIEGNDLDSPETRAILEGALKPLLEQGVDTLVLACTHFPFVIPVIREIAGESVEVVDPSPAIARQTRRLLEQHDLSAPGGRKARTLYYTTGNARALAASIQALVGQPGELRSASWEGLAVS